MARDINGNYSLPLGTPVVSGTVVSSVAFNTFAADVGAELTNSIDRAGRGAPTADLPMGGHRHTNVANANSRNTYTSGADVQDQNTVWCGVVGGTANALTLTPNPPITQLKDGQRFEAKIGAAANSGAMTVAISGLTPIPVVKNGSTAMAANDLSANVVVAFTVNNGATQAEVNKIKVGSIAAQDANAVAITGGTMAGVTVTGGSVDNAPIGGGTPAAGAFTTLQASGATQANGTLTAASQFALSGLNSPAQIVANTNDYNPANLATTTILRVTTDVSRNLTGLAGGAVGRHLLLLNVGTTPLVLTREDALSAAGNRFAFPSDITLQGNQGIALVYDSTSNRWRRLAGASKPVTVTVLTSGSGTYTTPTGATRLWVRGVGSGSGGSVGGSGPTNGNAGSAATFGPLTANGGAAPLTAGGAQQAKATATGGDLNIPGGLGQVANNAATQASGASGAPGPWGGQGGASGGTAGPSAPVDAAANSGSGGAAGTASGAATCGSAGNAGAYCEKTIVNPLATYSYSVPAGGAQVAGNGTCANSSAGGSGVWIIVEMYD